MGMGGVIDVGNHCGDKMKKDMQEWLDLIEVVDTTPTLERLKEIREQARRELEEENKTILKENRK